MPFFIHQSQFGKRSSYTTADTQTRREGQSFENDSQRICFCCASQDQPAIAPHCFKEGMKLEAVDPAAPISIRPATVTKVTDFPVKVFSNNAAMFLCHLVKVFCLHYQKIAPFIFLHADHRLN